MGKVTPSLHASQETQNPIEIFFFKLKKWTRVGIEGDLSTGVSCSLLGVPSLCLSGVSSWTSESRGSWRRTAPPHWALRKVSRGKAGPPQLYL